MTILFFISTLKETFPHTVRPLVLLFGPAGRGLKDVGVLGSSTPSHLRPGAIFHLLDDVLTYF